MGPRANEALPDSMRALLERGGLVLTANARAARALEHRYAEDQRGRGIAAWRSPRVLDVQSWLAQQWQDLLLTGTEDRLLLNDLQEQAVWTSILEPLLADRSLIQPARLAAQAREAYRLLAEHNALARLDDPAWLTEAQAEPELFHRWAQVFEQRCRRDRAIPACELPDAIARALRLGQLTTPREVGWLGFDRMPPALLKLERALSDTGSDVGRMLWPETSIVAPHLYTAKSEEQELRACTAWVQRQLMQQPRARIGVLLPDVAGRRASLERALHHRLSPERFPITAGATPTLPFEFSLGQPLSDVPTVRAALLLLRWLDGALTQSEITWLLLSCTLSWGATPQAREELSRWDAGMRNVKIPATAMTLDTYLRQRPFSLAAKQAARALASMQQQARRALRPARPGEWTERVQGWLDSAGWGAQSDASSLTFQAGVAWERLLDGVASLDHSAGRMTYPRFLETLTRTVRETIFAPESRDAPVQIMGVLAAAGQRFDAVWLLGATETAWPVPGRPHPLLPIALQRELGMPHATPEQETALAQAILDRIARSTPGEFVASYAEQTGESEQRASSLVAYYAPFEQTEVPQRLTPAVLLEAVPDDRWVPLPGDAASGGQNALKQQADCPFRAFALRRLHPKELPNAARGLTPADRGTLVHQTLQGIWQELVTQDALIASRDSGELRAVVSQHATPAVTHFRYAEDEPWRTAYLDAEEKRLIALLLEWLETECTRAPFRVASVESEARVDVGGLTLKLRLDRVDEVESGRLILDYKTGLVSLSSWEGDRPEQPQLPLYAAFASSNDLVGALFAQVRPSKMRLLGRVNEPLTTLGAQPGKELPPLTDEVIAHWRDALERLAIDFRSGEALVDPQRYPATCRYCTLPSLCRVAEHRRAENDGDEEDAATA